MGAKPFGTLRCLSAEARMAPNLWLSRKGRWSFSACMGCIGAKISGERTPTSSSLKDGTGARWTGRICPSLVAQGFVLDVSAFPCSSLCCQSILALEHLLLYRISGADVPQFQQSNTPSRKRVFSQSECYKRSTPLNGVERLAELLKGLR